MSERTPHAVRQLHTDTDQKPFIVIWEVTRACQLVCAHCRADSQHEPNPLELDTAAGKQLLDSLASYDAPRPIVVFTGGDPFERHAPELEVRLVDALHEAVAHELEAAFDAPGRRRR